MREEAVAAVEEVTGRDVLSFMSENDVNPDVSAEVFVLQPCRTSRTKSARSRPAGSAWSV